MPDLLLMAPNLTLRDFPQENRDADHSGQRTVC